MKKIMHLNNMPAIHSGFRFTLTATICATLSLTMQGCGSGGGDNPPSVPPVNTAPPTSPDITTTSSQIKVNQIGFVSQFPKMAVVPGNEASIFNVIDSTSQNVVFTGTLSEAATWVPADQQVMLADFSALSAEGQYALQIEGFENSVSFNISQGVYLEQHDAALKAYYFNRASTELTTEFAGQWARPLGHPDNKAVVHASAASSARPEGSVITSTKGWYDAGDFNKYIVNSGISTYTLLMSYLHHADFYQHRDGKLPESSNAVPDILDEVMWNLEWMQQMQDPHDGGVYHKLTTARFAGGVMPHQATDTRYVVQKGTGAALNFAGVMAIASRVYQEMPTFSQRALAFRQAAVSAFTWAQANPQVEYRQPDDIQTGIYGDSDFAGEFAWAAAELFLLTEDEQYLTVFNEHAQSPTVPGWQDTMALGYFSLLSEGNSLLSSTQYSRLQSALLDLANAIVDSHDNSAYRTAMELDDFVWGSNSSAMNKALVLMQAHRQTNDDRYIEAAVGLVDYIYGKNPLDTVFVTGAGENASMHPHHRQSYADGIAEPVPGFLVGGPQPGKQDGCAYTGNLPATTYLDDWCSFSTNEVTINWNAPLVYVLAALHNVQ
jgi:endoglucanase